MIKPGTPVRCRDDDSGAWHTIEWFYIGPRLGGGHIAEDEHGGYICWSHLEPLPRELQPGDSVYASHGDLNFDDPDSYSEYIFDGMYKEEFVCIHYGRKYVFKYAIHIDEVANDE